MNLLVTKHRKLILLFAAVTFLLTVSGWLLYPYISFDESFRRSKSDLMTYANRVTIEGPRVLAAPPHRLGYFNILRAETLPHGFILQCDYGGPFDWNGLAYSAQPLPMYENDAAGELVQMFTPIGDQWYKVFRAKP